MEANVFGLETFNRCQKPFKTPHSHSELWKLTSWKRKVLSFCSKDETVRQNFKKFMQTDFSPYAVILLNRWAAAHSYPLSKGSCVCGGGACNKERSSLLRFDYQWASWMENGLAPTCSTCFDQTSKLWNLVRDEIRTPVFLPCWTNYFCRRVCLRRLPLLSAASDGSFPVSLWGGGKGSLIA